LTSLEPWQRSSLPKGKIVCYSLYLSPCSATKEKIEGQRLMAFIFYDTTARYGARGWSLFWEAYGRAGLVYKSGGTFFPPSQI
jgi:hypothetical protein